MNQIIKLSTIAICIAGSAGSIYWAVGHSGPNPDEVQLPEFQPATKNTNAEIDSSKTEDWDSLKSITASRTFQGPLFVVQKPTTPTKTVSKKPNIKILDLFYSPYVKLATIDLGNGQSVNVSEGDKIKSIQAEVKSIKQDSIQIKASDNKIYNYKIPTSNKTVKSP